MTRMSLALMLSFFMVAHKAAGRFEVYEDMVQFLLVLGILSQRILKLKVCSVVLLPALKPACSSAMILSACGFNLFRMIQHDFTWMADEADRSAVLALLGPRGWPFSCLPDLIADCRESGDYILSTCSDQFCWDVVDSS